jgi:hypothetical protein
MESLVDIRAAAGISLAFLRRYGSTMGGFRTTLEHMKTSLVLSSVNEAAAPYAFPSFMMLSTFSRAQDKYPSIIAADADTLDKSAVRSLYKKLDTFTGAK